MASGKAYSKQSVKKTGRERKEKLVAELTDKIDETNGLVFADYKGATHQQLETLKRELKKDDSTIIIAKNSLMKISLGKSKNYKEAKDNEELEGPVATLLIKGDMVEPLKKLQKAAKEAGLPKVKFGVLEGQVLDEAAVVKIASLPNRETLLTQLAAMLNSPIQGFVTGLNSIPQKFVMTLDAVAKAKPAGEVQNNDSAKPEVATEVQADRPAADSAPVSTADKDESAASASAADDKAPDAPATEEKKDETPEEVATEAQNVDSASTTDKDESAASASTADDKTPAAEKDKSKEEKTDDKEETIEEGGEK